jgi:hypothetical protein
MYPQLRAAIAGATKRTGEHTATTNDFMILKEQRSQLNERKRELRRKEAEKRATVVLEAPVEVEPEVQGGAPAEEQVGAPAEEQVRLKSPFGDANRAGVSSSLPPQHAQAESWRCALSNSTCLCLSQTLESTPGSAGWIGADGT